MIKYLNADEYIELLLKIPVNERVTSHEYASKGITAILHDGVTYVLGGE